MKYRSFRATKDILGRLLGSLGAIREERNFIDLENYPDNNFTEYSKHHGNTYFFSNSWDFSGRFTVVLDAEIRDVQVFHDDHLEHISEYFGVCRIPKERYGDFLARAEASGARVMEHGIEPHFDGFRLNDVTVNIVDNMKKRIEIQGGYWAESDAVDPYDWKPVAECMIRGIPSGLEEKGLYLELIAESYRLFLNRDYRMSYFIAYSALECFVNFKLDSEDESKRLSEKIRHLFRDVFIGCDLSKHPIYSSMITHYEKHTKKRNAIAHGRGNWQIMKSEAEDVLVFSLGLILSVEMQRKEFGEII